MEYREAYATDLHAPGLRGLRRSSGKYDEPQLLRRRTGSRIDSPAHLDQEHEFRGHALVSSSFSYETVGTDDHCKLGDYVRFGPCDSVPLTPVADPNMVFNTRSPTSIKFSEAQDYFQVPRESSKASRAASVGPYDSAVSAASGVSPGARIPQTGMKRGPVNEFTQEWQKPLFLKAADIRGSLDDLDLTETNHRKPVDAVSLESGIRSPCGVLSMQWFDRWANFKWCLLFSVLSVFFYGIAGLICAIITWFRIWQKANVMFVTDHDILIFITLASSILIFTALTGLTGTLLSSRPILASYALLLWPSLIAMCAIGFTAYNRSTFALEQKLDMSWGQYYTPLGRLTIQNALQCCGWSSPLHEATPSGTCYPRTSLPGCKGSLLTFEQENLQLVWATVFSLLPMHMINMFVAILYAKRITRTFGTGIAPKKHRLTLRDVNLLMDRDGARIGGLKRPGIVRAKTNVAFREDREERVGLLEAYFDEVKEQ